MAEYFYPNEVDIAIEDGKRVAYLKPNWKDIRKKNENKMMNIEEEDPEQIKNGLLAQLNRASRYEREG